MQDTNAKRKFSLLQAPLLSFFSKDLYADVASNWKGFGAVYLLFILSISCLISASGFAVICHKFVTAKETRSFFGNLPKITVKEGHIYIDKPYPYNVKDASGAYTLITFVKNRDASELSDADPPIVVTNNSVLIKQSDSDKDPTALTPAALKDISENNPNLVIDGGEILQNIDKLWILLPIFTFIVGLPMIFIGHLLQLLIYGGAALIFATTLDKQINYTTALRVAAVAITPCIFISTIVTLLPALGVTNMGVNQIWSFASIAVALGYLYLACTAIKKPVSENAPAS